MYKKSSQRKYNTALQPCIFSEALTKVARAKVVEGRNRGRGCRGTLTHRPLVDDRVPATAVVARNVEHAQGGGGDHLREGENDPLAGVGERAGANPRSTVPVFDGALRNEKTRDRLKTTRRYSLPNS